MPSNTELTELSRLAHDFGEVGRIIRQNPKVAKPLADLTDPDRHARYLVIADIAWQVWLNAGSVQLLLAHEFFTAALIVTRSIFEAFASLHYLVRHSNSQDEAVLFLAFSYMQQARDLRHDKPFSNEMQSILDRMPSHLVEEARKRRRQHPRTWSGKTLRQVCEEGGVTGYTDAYPYLSSNVHSTLLGQHVRVIRDDEHRSRVETGRSVTQKDIESLANLVRRMLHTVMKILWAEFDAPPVRLCTTDPFKWSGLAA